MSKPLDRLTAKIKDLLNERPFDPSDRTLSGNYKEVAQLLVEARRDHFLNNDGNPDLRGISWDYRRWMSDEILNGQDPRVAARLRYHTGNALREVIPPEDLKAAGLLKESPQERSKQINNEIAEVAHLFKGAGPIQPEDVPQVMGIIRKLMMRMTAESRTEADRLSPGAGDLIHRLMETK